MINNYFYELPQDLQEKIFCINTQKYRYIMNNEFKSLFRASKYIDKVVYTWTPSLTASQTIIFDTAVLGYSLNATDVIILNGRWA